MQSSNYFNQTNKEMDTQRYMRLYGELNSWKVLDSADSVSFKSPEDQKEFNSWVKRQEDLRKIRKSFEKELELEPYNTSIQDETKLQNMFSKVGEGNVFLLVARGLVSTNQDRGPLYPLLYKVYQVSKETRCVVLDFWGNNGPDKVVLSFEELIKYNREGWVNFLNLIQLF